MIHKFECKKCGKEFSSEGKEQVRCPHCGSDNVEYASIHVPYKYIGIIICLALIVFLLSKIDYSSLFSSVSSNGKDDTEVLDSISDDNIVEDNIIDDLNKEIEELEIEIPPTIKGVDKMELDDDGNYNVVIKIEHAPQKGYNVVIIDQKTNKAIASSDNGVFKSVPYSKNEGKYYAQIVNASTKEPLSEQTEITGFVEVKSISKKLSVTELQNLINNQDPSLLGHDNEYLSPVCKIKYTDLPKGSDYAPDNLADVFEMLDFGTWTSVEVTSLEYNNTKHISSITLKVNTANRPDLDN